MSKSNLDLFHPVQILSDLFTIQEEKGRLAELKLAYVGDGNNVCNSLLIGCSKVGIDITVACPKGYEPNPIAIEWAKRNASESGSTVSIIGNPIDACKNADVVYTDTFISMGMEKERNIRLRVFLPTYQVNSRLFDVTKKDCIFMHCLPAHRGEEVTTDVIDGPRSIVWIQAENRLFAQEALLARILT
jgi:ornithine carbamoyltransferase